MAIDPTTYYGTIAEADTYFGEKLHESDWLGASTSDKEKALLAATRGVDALLYSGVKNPVYVLLLADPDATDAEIEAAAATQLLEFPRDDDTEVPTDIERATYEEARELIRGRDPQFEFENLAIVSDGAGSTRFTNDVNDAPAPHLRNGIVSYAAWRYLAPYLDDNTTFRIIRSS